MYNWDRDSTQENIEGLVPIWYHVLLPYNTCFHKYLVTVSQRVEDYELW